MTGSTVPGRPCVVVELETGRPRVHFGECTGGPRSGPTSVRGPEGPGATRALGGTGEWRAREDTGVRTSREDSSGVSFPAFSGSGGARPGVEVETSPGPEYRLRRSREGPRGSPRLLRSSVLSRSLGVGVTSVLLGSETADFPPKIRSLVWCTDGNCFLYDLDHESL